METKTHAQVILCSAWQYKKRPLPMNECQLVWNASDSMNNPLRILSMHGSRNQHKTYSTRYGHIISRTVHTPVAQDDHHLHDAVHRLLAHVRPAVLQRLEEARQQVTGRGGGQHLTVQPGNNLRTDTHTWGKNLARYAGVLMSSLIVPMHRTYSTIYAASPPLCVQRAHLYVPHPTLLSHNSYEMK